MATPVRDDQATVDEKRRDFVRVFDGRFDVPITVGKDHRNLAQLRCAEIVADVADFSAAEDLVELLGDRDPEVRMHMARGLKRIVGRDMNVTPEHWRDASSEERAAAIKRWRAWLENRVIEGRSF